MENITEQQFKDAISVIEKFKQEQIVILNSAKESIDKADFALKYSKKMDDVLNMKIKDCGYMDVRMANSILRNIGSFHNIGPIISVDTVLIKHIASLRKYDVRKFAGAGKKTVDDIEDFLHHMGLYFGHYEAMKMCELDTIQTKTR